MDVPRYPWRRNALVAASMMTLRFLAERPLRPASAMPSSLVTSGFRVGTRQSSSWDSTVPSSSVGKQSERDTTMNTVISKDGTNIAFDRLGTGPAIILVGGAFTARAMTYPLAELLAKD